ncbi:hypothetical protein RB601_001846 [Gaeumannomyces tritici]
MEADQIAMRFVELLGQRDEFDAQQYITDCADTSGLDGWEIQGHHRTIYHWVTSYVWDLECRDKTPAPTVVAELAVIRRIAKSVFDFKTDHHVPQMAFCALLAIGILEWLAPTINETLFPETEGPACETRGGYSVNITPDHLCIPYAPEPLLKDFVSRLRIFYTRVV